MELMILFFFYNQVSSTNCKHSWFYFLKFKQSIFTSAYIPVYYALFLAIHRFIYKAISFCLIFKLTLIPFATVQSKITFEKHKPF